MLSPCAWRWQPHGKSARLGDSTRRFFTAAGLRLRRSFLSRLAGAAAGSSAFLQQARVLGHSAAEGDVIKCGARETQTWAALSVAGSQVPRSLLMMMMKKSYQSPNRCWRS
jgi:hypothetical protein